MLLFFIAVYDVRFVVTDGSVSFYLLLFLCCVEIKMVMYFCTAHFKFWRGKYIQ
jgi:hypothetical protein